MVVVMTFPAGHRGSSVGVLDAQTDRSRANALFELSRIEVDGVVLDANVPFDFAIHTLAAIAAGIENHIPLSCRDCDPILIPAKRVFRNAWEDTGTSVEVNMPKARVIHMDRIRVVRDIELEKETGSKFPQPPEIEALFTPARKARLRALRDIPGNFDLSVYTTPDTLDAAWPTELPSRI